MNSKEDQIADALTLMPTMKVIDSKHRLGIKVEIDRNKIKFKLDEFESSWAYARKGRIPAFFSCFFTGIDKNCLIHVDNYCNIIEDGDGLERGECEMVFDGSTLVQLHDLI